MLKPKFCGFMTNAGFALQDHCWMENQASCLFSKSHVWKPSACKNLSWFGLKPDFEISAFMKQKCLSSGSPSSRVKIWAPLHFMQSFSLLQSFIPLQSRDKKFYLILVVPVPYDFPFLTYTLLMGRGNYWPRLLLSFLHIRSRTGREFWRQFCCFYAESLWF